MSIRRSIRSAKLGTCAVADRRYAWSPVNSYASHTIPGQKLVVQPTLAPSGWPPAGGRSRYLLWIVVSPGYRVPNSAMFASSVRSAAATAASTASASGLERTSIAVMKLVSLVIARHAPEAVPALGLAPRAVVWSSGLRYHPGHRAERGPQRVPAVGPHQVEQ